MLRLVLGLSLLIGGLSLLRSPPMCRPDLAPPAKRTTGTALNRPRPLPAEVKGYGLTVETARKDAETRAADLLAEELRRDDPTLARGDGKATQERLVEHVRTYVAAGSGKALDDVALDENLPPSKVWSLPLRSNPDWDALIRAEQTERAHLQSAERQLRARSRQSLSVRLLGVFGLVLCASFAYCRLDLWTRGRYTILLRAASATILLALGIGCWFMMT